MLKSQRTRFVLFALFALAPSVARGQAARPESFGIERYLNIRSATSPAFAPRGDRVMFLMNTTGTAQVWSVAGVGGWPEQLTAYEDRVDFVEWSPAGTGLIFGQAVGGNENAQFYWLAP